MKSVLTITLTISLSFGVYAQAARARYALTDLGTIGPAGQVFNIAGNGLVAGAVQQPDNTLHAALFYGRQTLDISRPGIGGKNSLTYGVNLFGQAVGGAETAEPDPGAVDFCGFKTLGLSSSGPVCAAFIWQNGLMKKLPTLGGNNGSGTQVNTWGIVSGEVENTTPDPGCPQRFEFRPVKWQGSQIIPLATYADDPDGVAYAINDAGQVVGSTGTCAPYNPNFQLAMVPQHPMLWEADGTPRYLGTLGGTGNNPNSANLAININNRGHAVGTSALVGDETGHAFLWTRETGMQDLGTLDGDFASGAVAINDGEQITGISIGPNGPRAFVWQNGSMSDLNDLVRPTSLHLLLGTAINAGGQIAGLAVDTRNGAVHGYVATPLGRGDSEQDNARRLFTVEDVRRVLEQLRPLSRHGIRFAPGW
jgi:probable HAF family extracellular repeat protein